VSNELHRRPSAEPPRTPGTPRTPSAARERPLHGAPAFALALTPPLLWGALPVAIAAITPAMDAITLTWYRFVLAWAGQTVLLAVTGALGELRGRSTREYAMLAVVAAGIVGNFALFASSLAWLSPSAAQTVAQCQPIALLLASVLLFGERLSRLQSIGGAVLVTGLVVFLHDRARAFDGRADELLIGVPLVLAASAAWVASGLAQKALAGGVSAAASLWFVYLLGAVALAPLSSPGTIAALSGAQSWLFAFCCVNTLVAYGAFSVAVRRWDLSRVGAVLALQVVFTYLYEFAAGRLGLGLVRVEDWDAVKLLGAALVVGGTLVAALAVGKRR
jgi:drug/metabolite transporter (DMT)-like permease